MKNQLNKQLYKKVILAFSGGLDTSFCALYLQEQGYEVITLTVNTGGFTQENLNQIAKQAKKVKSSKHIFIDGTKEIYDKFASYIIKGNILRGGVYPLCVGPERMIIAEKLVQIAQKHNAIAVCHGSTGAGNDQIRFDVTLHVLAPQLHIVTPIRDLGISRKQELAFLEKHNIATQDISKSYSINVGLLGTTIGGTETNSSWETLPDTAYPTVVPIAQTPDKPNELIISFTKGLPTALDGKHMDGVSIIEYLNKLGATYGVGKNTHLGNTILGIKGRVGFEAPAATILVKTHTELEKLVLTKWQLFWKETLCNAYGNFIHESMYFEPVVKDMQTFIDSTQDVVTGDVHVKLDHGSIIIQGYNSPYSLMNPHIATYGEENHLWTASDAKGFAKIYGLQSMLAHKAKKRGGVYENR